MRKQFTDQQRQQIRRAIRRATLDLSYDKQRVARWLEDAALRGRVIDIKAGAGSLKMSFNEFYELVGRVMDAVCTELRELDLDLES